MPCWRRWRSPNGAGGWSRAIADGLSVEDLRTELRAARRPAIVASGAADTANAPPRTVRCPNCGKGVPIPAAGPS